MLNINKLSFATKNFLRAHGSDSNTGGGQGAYSNKVDNTSTADNNLEETSQVSYKSLDLLSEIYYPTNFSKAMIKTKPSNVNNSTTNKINNNIFKPVDNNIFKPVEKDENISFKSKKEVIKNQYFQAIDILREGNYQQGISKLSEIVSLAQQNNYKNLEIKALETIAKAYDKKGDLQQSLNNYQKAFLIAYNGGKTEKQLQLSNNIASIYAEKGEYQTSLAWYNEALILANKLEDVEAIDIILEDMDLVKKQIYLILELAV